MHYPARAALERKKTAIFVFWRPQNAGFSMGNLIANQGRRSFFFAADVSKKRHSRHGAIGFGVAGPLDVKKRVRNALETR